MKRERFGLTIAKNANWQIGRRFFPLRSPFSVMQKECMTK
nr:MAG TPA: hypothetical protein [Caudoviricetes sp.]